MDSVRVAIFDEWWPVNLEGDYPSPKVDTPSEWARFMHQPRFFTPDPEAANPRYMVRDDRVLIELERLITFKTCPICRSAMRLRDTYFWLEGEELYICLVCGYWAGIGYRDWGSHRVFQGGPTRGVIARYKSIKPFDHEQTDYLVSHLRRAPHDLTKISPKRAEKFVVDLLSDYLDAEVRPLGGTKDKGIDGFILKGDQMACIVQIKWRQSTARAESVRVVREVAGTLVARGVPIGILVSNRIRYSKDAQVEAREISKREVVGLGRLSLSLLGYQDVIDMLELSATRLTSQMTIEDWFQVPEDMCVFDGASFITKKHVEKYL